MLLIKKFIFALIVGLVLPSQAFADSHRDDELLSKFVSWHLGFTSNVIQRDVDLAAKANPRWGLSELRFQQIWRDREDGYWIYYETSQPDVRPDRNQIWRLFRNDQGDLKVDLYFFNDVEKGLTFWGKGNDATAFENVSIDELTTREGCNATYHWREKLQRFVGVNPHGECLTIGKSYLLQHVEISKNDDGNLVRKDWHSFYDENGIAKRGGNFKLGDQGATIHIYSETYQLKP